MSKTLRIKGHKLSIYTCFIKNDGERISTGQCTCGWTESTSYGDETRREYKIHLKRVQEKALEI